MQAPREQKILCPAAVSNEFLGSMNGIETLESMHRKIGIHCNQNLDIKDPTLQNIGLTAPQGG